MADIKHHFRAGRMNKDLDERLVPNGEYIDAQNIEIITSEGSDVGSIQNVLGNTLKDGRNFDNSTGTLINWGSSSSSIKDLTNPKCIGYVVDPQNDKVYWFISAVNTATALVNETGVTATASVNDTTVNQSSTINIDNISGTVSIGDVVEGTGIIGEVKVTAISSVDGGLQVIFIDSLQTIANDVSLTFTPKRTAIVLDNNSRTIQVGMTVSGAGIFGKVTVATVTNQNNITLSRNSGPPDNALLTFKSQISCIAEFDSTTGEVSPVLVDKNNILKYSDEYLITGANVISGLLSWTDNQTEPKLIKISKFKAGSSTFNYHTQINNADFTEKDITVIKQSPLNAPTLTMSSTERTQSSFGVEGGTPVSIKKDFYSEGSVLTTGSSFDITFSNQANFIKDDIIILEHIETSNLNETKHTITVKILGLINSEIITEGFPDSNTYSATCIIQTINTNLPDLGLVNWTATLKEKDPLFENTFVRFAYRYKYKEGQYSTFSPFSEVAFLPSEFLYESDESHNVGMQNSLRTLSLGGFDPQPEDVELVEILVKDSVSNAVYVVDVLKNKETSYSVLSESFGALVESNQILRPFDNVPKKAKAQEIIANRLIFANYHQGYNLLKQNTPDVNVTIEQNPSNLKTTATVAASNNTTSNVITLSAFNPLIEKGMLITGEGIPNHTFVKDISNTTLTISAETKKFSDISKITTKYVSDSWNVYVEENTILTFTKTKIPEKSVKSLRTYQVGTTYSDKYGRETPVFSSKKSSIKLPKSFGITKNRINVQLQNNAPDWATHYKFFIKETSSEYYNLALDKFYFAEDGNIWLSFPSAERNKVDEETYLILKKQHDNDNFVSEKARYRVLDISNEAPAFISQKLISSGKANCSTLSVNQPSVGSTFFQFNGPEASSNPSFSSAFVTESEIQISTDIPTNDSPTAKVNGATSDSTDLAIDNNNGIIRVGDKVVGTEVSGDVTVKTIIDQNNLVLSSVQTISDNADLTFIAAPAKISRKYKIESGGLSSSGTVYDVTLKDPIHESDEDVFASSLVSDGSDISVNIFRKTIEPKDEFFGRFFVKISRDTVLDENIIEAFPSVKSRFDIVKSETINLNLLNDFSNKDQGSEKPKQDFAWGDQDFGSATNPLNSTNTHPKKGSEFFEFYFGGIDIGKYGAEEDDININVNSLITEITKPGSLIQFSNDFGDKGQIYEVTGSSVKSEFRTNNTTKRTWVSGKRRLYKVFIKNQETGELYDDSFNASTASSTLLGRISKISLVKKNIQVDDEKISSNNPAIFETEPKTKEGLDIYHEASNALPIVKAGMTVTGTNVGSGNSNIVSSVVDGSNIKLLNNTNGTMSSGTVLTFTDQDNIYSFTAITSGDVSTTTSVVLAQNQVHGQINSLDWYNVFSFGNGVESNRIRDDFNAPFIDKGPIVSTTLNEDYKEENKTNTFIFSGIFNSTSGVNELNQFLLALPITKDINPEYGTIQRIYARDADLITFCEDKILKVLANKDALFNADGSANLTATNAVLGQAIPFVGEYGISKNPESFASHAFRIYFADKARGAVLRLSRDGLTEISEKGMTDFFGDNLPLSTTILGSYNDDKGSYNITLNNQTLSFDERVDGWTSFKSFIPEAGFSLNNIYYTYKNGDLYSHDNTVRNTFYGTAYASSVKFIFNDFPQSVKSFKTLNYEGSDSRKYTYGRNPTSGDFHSKAQAAGEISNSEFTVEDTIEIKNIQLSSTSSATGAHISVGDTVKLDNGTNLGTVVRIVDAFHLLNSVSSAAEKIITLSKTVQGLSIQANDNLNFQPAYGAGTELEFIKKQGLGSFDLSVYTQLSTGSVIDLLPEGISTLVETETKGWFAESITTDQQTGSVRFFKEKENFKFNKILGDDTTSSNLDTKEFSVQGLGMASAVNISQPGTASFTLTINSGSNGIIDNATINPATVTYTQLTDSQQVGSNLSDAVFTITPNTGFVISASDVSANTSAGSRTIQDTGTAGTSGNTVTVTVDIDSTITPTSNTNINISISAIVKPEKYTVTGTFSTDEKNTTTSSLYNFGYSGIGNYYLNAKVNGLSTDSSPVLHPEKSALMQTAASSTTNLVLDNIFNNEIISVGDTITGTGVTTITAKVNGNVSDSSTVNVDNNSGTIAVGMVVTGGGISELITVTNASSQSAPVLSKNVNLSDNEDLNFGVAITAKASQVATTSNGDQASVTVTNAQTISNNVAIAISSNKIFENMAIIGSGVPDNALIKLINGTSLSIKDGLGRDLNATIPDDTILRFGTEIISKTFVADTGFEFKSAPTLDILEEDESNFSDYTSSHNFVSTTSSVDSDVNNSTTVTLSSSNSLIAVGMAVSGLGISSFTTVSNISSTTLTLSTAAKISANTTLSFFPTSVTLKVYYVFSSNNPTEDRILLTAIAEKTFLDVADEITSMEMSRKSVSARGETRFIRIFGRSGAKFKLKRFTTGTVNGTVSGSNSITLDNTNAAVLSGMKIEGGSVQSGLRVSSVSTNTITASSSTTIADDTELTFSEFWNGNSFNAFETLNSSLIQTIPSTGVYSIPVEYSSTSIFRTFNYEVEAKEDTVLATDFNDTNPVSIDQTAEVTWTISPNINIVGTNPTSTSNLSITGTSFSEPKELTKSSLVNFSFTITAAGGQYLTASRDILDEDFGYSTVQREISTAGNGSTSNLTFNESTRVFSIQTGSTATSSIVSGGTLPSGTTIATKNAAGSFDISLSNNGDQTGISLAANNVSVGDILTFSVPHSWIIEYSNLKGVLSKEVSATRTAEKNGAINGSTALVVDNNSGTIAVGDVITGEGIEGLVSVITVTDQQNLVMSSSQTIADDVALTFTKFAPQTYTITGILNVLRFGTKSLTSSIGLTGFLRSIASADAPSVPANTSLTLSGLYDSTSSNSGGFVRVKKAVTIGSGNGAEDNDVISGSGVVFFRGDGNTVNGVTLSITSSERFDDQSITNIKLFDQVNNQLTGFDLLPSFVNTRASFDFTVTCNGDVVSTDTLRVTIKVQLSNVL